MTSSQLHEERVTFSSREGRKLVGVLSWQETDSSQPSPAAILCHGYGSNKNGFHMEVISKRLAAEGIAALRFDFSGNGESEGPFRFAYYASEAEQIQTAIEFLERRGHMVTAILGHSKGGTDIILHAAKYDTGKVSYINVCGRFDLTDLKSTIEERFGPGTLGRLKQDGSVQVAHPRPDQPPFTLTQEDLEDRLSTDVKAAAQSIRNSRVLTLHGSADSTIPVRDAHDFAACIQNHTLRVVEGADHRFTQPQHAQIVIDDTVRFINEART